MYVHLLGSLYDENYSIRKVEVVVSDVEVKSVMFWCVGVNVLGEDMSERIDLT